MTEINIRKSEQSTTNVMQTKDPASHTKRDGNLMADGIVSVQVEKTNATQQTSETDSINLPPGKLKSSDMEDIRSNVFDVLALLAKLSNSLREAANDRRWAELETFKTEMDSHISKLKDAAETRLITAVACSSFELASAAVSVGISGKSMSHAKKAHSLQKQSIKNSSSDGAEGTPTTPPRSNGKKAGAKEDKLDPLRVDASLETTKSDALTTNARTAGQINQAISSSGKAGGNMAADKEQADAQEEQKEADIARTYMDAMHEVVTNTQQFISSVIQHIQSMEESVRSANAHIAQRI